MVDLCLPYKIGYTWEVRNNVGWGRSEKRKEVSATYHGTENEKRGGGGGT